MDLIEKLHDLAGRWDRIGDKHGIRQFTGNDHKLFANELRTTIVSFSPLEGYMLVPVKMTDEIGDALREAMDYGYCAESAWDLAIHAANKQVTK